LASNIDRKGGRDIGRFGYNHSARPSCVLLIMLEGVLIGLGGGGVTVGSQTGKRVRRWAVAGFAALLVLGGGGYLAVSRDAEAIPVVPAGEAPPRPVLKPKEFQEPLDPAWPNAPGADLGPSDSDPLLTAPQIPTEEQRAGTADEMNLLRTVKEPFSLTTLPWNRRYVSSTVLTSFPNETSSGVCMDKRTNPPRPHPVAAAHCGEMMWNNYRISNDPAWLTKAKLQARWLINFKQVYSGAWFYPYLWDHTLAASATKKAIVLKKPWYSAMAQGEALSLFVRLYETTKQPEFKEAADKTFASLIIAPQAGRPWATWNYYDYLWFEETTFGNATGDRILNGHMFATFGVYDYWAMTQDRRARELLRASLATALTYGGRLRNVNWRSYYDDYRRGDANGYHFTHTSQLRYLAEMTGDQRFNRAALMLWLDYPSEITNNAMYIAKGTVATYKLVNGRPVFHKNVTVPSNQLTVMTWRGRLKGYSGFYQLAGAGILKGLYVQQKAFTAYVNNPSDLFVFRVPYKPTTKAATVKYRTFDKSGNAGATITAEPGKGEAIQVGMYGVIKGTQYYQVFGGEYDGMWVAGSDLNV
jgi:hypothetical protein